MYKRKNAYRHFLWILIALSAVACRRENDHISETALWHIVESEKLPIPSAIGLPDNGGKGYSRVATFFAEGVQKYKAQQKAGSNPIAYEWVFVAPQADLFDITNTKAGTHTAGPAWQLNGDADSIFAQALNPPRAAPGPVPNSVDWLLLVPKAGKTATGIFTGVEYIQRIATKGGKAPLRQPKHADETVEVKYTAVYRFSKKNG